MAVSAFMKRVSDVASDLADHGPVVGWRKAPELPIDQVFARLGAEHGVDPEDVRDEVRDAANFAERFKAQNPDFVLSIDQVAAIRIYTMDSIYPALNKAMRDENRNRIKPFFPYLKLILPAIELLPKFGSGRPTWRGVRLDLAAQYPEGREFIDWSFSSTTTNSTATKNFLGTSGPRTLFRYTAVSGVDIHTLSAYGKTEDEVLMKPGIKYRVVQNIDAGGVKVIELKEVDDAAWAAEVEALRAEIAARTPLTGGVAAAERLALAAAAAVSNSSQCRLLGGRAQELAAALRAIPDSDQPLLAAKPEYGELVAAVEAGAGLCLSLGPAGRLLRLLDDAKDRAKLDAVAGRLEVGIAELGLLCAKGPSPDALIAAAEADAKAADEARARIVTDELGCREREEDSFDAVRKVLLALHSSQDKSGVGGVGKGASHDPASDAWKINPKEVKKSRVYDEDEEIWTAAEPLGKGSFGVVYRGRYRNKHDVAIKEVDVGSDHDREALESEVRVLGLIAHAHIAKFYGAFTKGAKGTMVLELCVCSVSSALYFADCEIQLGSDDKKATVRAVVDAMAYLHSYRPKIVHRDLKPENVMLTRERVAKLIDFGLARTKASSASRAYFTAAGTMAYMAPELLSAGGRGSHTVDQYGFAVMVNEIFSGARPFLGVDAREVERSVVKGARPELASGGPGWAKQIVEACWLPDPKKRPEFAAVKLAIEEIVAEDNLRAAEAAAGQALKAELAQQKADLAAEAERQLAEQKAAIAAEAERQLAEQKAALAAAAAAELEAQKAALQQEAVTAKKQAEKEVAAKKKADDIAAAKLAAEAERQLAEQKAAIAAAAAELEAQKAALRQEAAAAKKQAEKDAAAKMAEGNEAFKAADYPKAIAAYTEA